MRIAGAELVAFLIRFISPFGIAGLLFSMRRFLFSKKYNKRLPLHTIGSLYDHVFIVANRYQEISFSPTAAANTIAMNSMRRHSFDSPKKNMPTNAPPQKISL